MCPIPWGVVNPAWVQELTMAGKSGPSVFWARCNSSTKVSANLWGQAHPVPDFGKFYSQ